MRADSQPQQKKARRNVASASDGSSDGDDDSDEEPVYVCGEPGCTFESYNLTQKGKLKGRHRHTSTTPKAWCLQSQQPTRKAM